MTLLHCLLLLIEASLTFIPLNSTSISLFFSPALIKMSVTYICWYFCMHCNGSISKPDKNSCYSGVYILAGWVMGRGTHNQSSK